MVELFVIMGYNNVSDWNDKDFDSISLDMVYHKKFDNEKEKSIFINALSLLDSNMRGLSGNYLLISKDEYETLLNY